VARIRLYDKVLAPLQITGLDRLPSGVVVSQPRFLTPFFQTNVLKLPVSNVVPGMTYHLLASSNLINWSSILTSTPSADPATFVDPAATNFPKRFYRLIKP